MMGRSHALLGAVGYVAFTESANFNDHLEHAEKWAFDQNNTVASIYGWFIRILEFVLNKDVAFLPYLAAVIFVAVSPYTVSNRKAFMSSWWYRALMFWSVIMLFLTGSQWITSLFPQVLPGNPFERILWMSVCAGLAVFPDLDEPNSTIARLFGPFARIVGGFTRKIAGGHRYGTHSWIAVVALLFIAYLGQTENVFNMLFVEWFQIDWFVYVPRIISGVVIMVAYIMAARLLLPDRATSTSYPVMILGAFVAWAIALGNMNMLPMLVVGPLGILLHVAGDWVTNSGIAFWYPNKTKYAVNYFSTNGEIEHWIVVPVLSVLLGLSVVFWFGIPMLQWIGSGEGNQFFQNYPAFGQNWTN